jgi:hypothetical protein
VKTPQKLADVMATNATLSLLLRQAQELRGLEGLLNARVGDAFAQNCKVAAFREDGTLLLVAKSPVWATRLRYLVPDLIAWARGVPEFRSIKSIHVQVQRPPG